MNTLRILAVGDIVGPAAVQVIENNLWKLREEYRADLCVVNAENAAVGNGLDVAGAKSILFSGADVITSGNHIWQKRELRDFMADNDRILRPANYPAGSPGNGYTVVEGRGYRFLVINVLGCIFMEPLDNPFDTVDKILTHEEGRYDFAVLDIHAEATSEKIALARYLDGRVSVIFGTHTHVQTADTTVLPQGSGYLTDLGMTGPENSVLGVQSEIIIEKMRTRLPVRFQLAEGAIALCGALFTLDADTGHVTDICLVRRTYSV